MGNRRLVSAAQSAVCAVVMGDVLTQPNRDKFGFSLGLGLTNECNLACSFGYRD